MEPSDLEAKIAAQLDARDFAAAATIALRGYGPQIFAYLASLALDETRANDAFSMFCEDFWRGIPSFRRDASVRTWAYALAYHAVLRCLRDPYEQRGRAFATGDAERLAAEVRSTTALHLRTSSKDALAEIRASLAPDEQTLLILRVDRELAWSEIARVFGDDSPASVASLRKRLERLKDKLRQEAIARGLISE